MTTTDHIPIAEDSLREEAVKNLKKKQDFHAHLLVYVLVNALLWGIWALTDAWPALVSLGWGVGLVMNVGRCTCAGRSETPRCGERSSACGGDQSAHG
jgi:hypothetical protein